VRIRAAALNYRDQGVIKGAYGYTKFPVIPLSDGAGEVAAIGPGVTQFKPGDRVASTFFVNWTGGRIPPNASHNSLGGMVDGVLAEFAVLNETGAIKIPDLMAIENEVARVRGEIERFTGRLRFLANRVDLATIQAEVSQKPKKAPGGFWDFNRTIARIQAAFLNTVRELLAVAEGLVAFGAAVLPLVLLGALGWGLVRRSLRRADRAA